MYQKILYISQKPPEPIVDGGTKAIQLCYESLKDKKDIDALFLSTAKHPGNEKNKAQQYFVHTNYRSILRNFSQGHFPTFIRRFYDARLKRKINRLISENQYDQIWVDGFFMLVNIPKQHLHKVIYRSHNIEYEIWKQKWESASGVIRKLSFYFIYKEIYRSEIKFWKKVKRIASISSDDCQIMQQYNNSCFLLPYAPAPCPLVNKSAPALGSFNTFHLGSMHWFPNIDALKHFTQDIIPNITWPEQATFHIIGGKEPNFKSQKWIEQHGFVEDLNSFLTDMHLLIAPIRKGSGVRIKIMDVLALNIPVLTTMEGALGLPESLKKLVFIFNSPEEFSAQLHHIRTNYNDICLNINKEYQNFYNHYLVQIES